MAKINPPVSSCEGSACTTTSDDNNSSFLFNSRHNDNNAGVAAARFRRNLHYILLLDNVICASADVDEDGQEQQERARVRLQECACPRRDYSYSGYDSDYECLSDNDSVCEDDCEIADIAENYDRQQSKRSNKRNQKSSNKKELRRIKVAGKNSSKNPSRRFAKNAAVAQAAKRDERIALGAAERRKRDHYHCSSDRSNQPWPHQRQHQHQHYEQQHILSAEHLLGAAGGDNRDAMYQRLVEIANGAEITPEDYDLLLLLDENNVRATLQASQVEQFELLAIADNVNDDSEDEKQITGRKYNYHAVPVAVSRQSLGSDGLCLICLQSFAQLENGFELRRLPCQHVYCRSCIELWLAEFDAKCPELSCFWNSNDNRS